MPDRQQNHALRIGLFGIGLDAYWAQFDGLRERLVAYLEQVENSLKRPGVEVVNLRLIDTPEKALSDGPNAWPLPKMQALLETLIAIDQVTKRNGFLESA